MTFGGTLAVAFRVSVLSDTPHLSQAQDHAARIRHTCAPIHCHVPLAQSAGQFFIHVFAF
jgi:hypothetical protein